MIVPLEVGDLVYAQLYNPQCPAHNSTIEERIAEGNTYGGRRLMRLAGIIPNYNSRAYAQEMGADVASTSVTRWWLVNPDRPGDESKMSWVESDWCVLDSAAADNGMLW